VYAKSATNDATYSFSTLWSDYSICVADWHPVCLHNYYYTYKQEVLYMRWHWYDNNNLGTNKVYIIPQYTGISQTGTTVVTTYDESTAFTFNVATTYPCI
jgi:hypothetical protein